MTPRLFVGVSVAALLAASGYFAWVVFDYLNSPVAPSSTSGNRVFFVDGAFAAYPPLRLGIEPALVGWSLVMLVAAVFVAAYTRSRNLSSTAEENAAAQTR
jgi:hypothetical protein